MQDISRDDFSLLNGGDAVTHSTEKDMCPTLIFRIQNTSPLNSNAVSLPKQQTNEENDIPPFVPVKLEDINTIDLFPSNSSNWQQHPTNANNDLGDHRSFLNSRNSYDNNCTNLLLQGSDDPLISHGANSVLFHDDEHPADFANSLITQVNNHLQHSGNKPSNQEEITKLSSQQTVPPQRLVKSGCSNLTKQQLKVKANLMSARNQQQQQNQNITSSLNTTTITSASSQKHQSTQKTKPKKGTAVKLRFHHQALPPEYLSHYQATEGQQQISKNQQKPNTSNQRSVCKSINNSQKQSQPRNSHENVRSWLQKIAEIQRTANASKESATSQIQKPKEKQGYQQSASNTCQTQRTTNRELADAINNNCQSQKAVETQNLPDVTHSSTINGDQFLVGANNRANFKRSIYSDLPYMGEITLDNCKPRRGRKPKKADICHLIYKNYGTILPKKTRSQNQSNQTSGLFNAEGNNGFKDETGEQPLNLCLRDQMNDFYSISSGDEVSETNSSCPTPVSTPLDYVRDSMLANNLQKSLSNINEQNEDEKALNRSKISTLSSRDEKVTPPITMCYQKLLESGVLLHNTSGHYQTITKDNQLALKIPLPSGLFPPQKLKKSISSPVGLNLEYPEPLGTPSSLRSENSLVSALSSAPNQQQIVPQKRKRSAIFIPPMNVENINNPATEVSICKFKFTGGSKPSLQEKKMISVDAGGNYRYFSGTGDKASRGYEYFPRESLQHTSGLLPGVNCIGQKLTIDIPPPSAGLSNDLLQMPESPSSSLLLPPGRSINIATDSIPTTSSYEVSKNKTCSYSIKENSSYSSSSPTTTLTTNRCLAQRKKNAIPHQLRKSSQREKLEKKLKEQGFLIQTQQLESAEGATYCKFRQLKKLTRYLFRNWKDYLPNGMQENANTDPVDTLSYTSENLEDTATAKRQR